jgi:hypothetical protein
MRVRPQAAPFLSDLALSVGKFASLVVPDVTPGEAFADQFQVDEAVAELDSSNLAPVAVDVHDFDTDDLAEHLGG